MPHGNVIPAHAGIQDRGNGLDSRVRGNDDLALLWHVCFPEYRASGGAPPAPWFTPAPPGMHRGMPWRWQEPRILRLYVLRRLRRAPLWQG